MSEKDITQHNFDVLQREQDATQSLFRRFDAGLILKSFLQRRHQYQLISLPRIVLFQEKYLNNNFVKLSQSSV
jgi:hypothetical protein